MSDIKLPPTKIYNYCRTKLLSSLLNAVVAIILSSFNSCKSSSVGWAIVLLQISRLFIIYTLLCWQEKLVVLLLGLQLFFLFALSITGIIFWSGWHKLINGFKIKTNTHIKRPSFDIYKVLGILPGIFIGINGFTGFCWIFYAYSQPVIYAATFTPTPVKPKSKPIDGKSTIEITEMFQRADIALPGAKTTYISFPITPESVFMLGKQFPEEKEVRRTRVYLDQYTG